MDQKIPLYQRAVTPTLDTNSNSNNNFASAIRGKVLSYNSNNQTNTSSTRNRSSKSALLSNEKSSYRSSTSSPTNGGRRTPASPRTSNNTMVPTSDFNIQGRGANSRSGSNGTYGQRLSIDSGSNLDISNTGLRSDLLQTPDESPADGIVIARVKNRPDCLVVYRTAEERLRNPERLNLDRRQLEICPILEQEQRLRLLNYQNNNIKIIQNLENLPNLIFLDLYNNKITSLEGPLSTVKGLRVLMAGKNKINVISNLNTLKKLDVLDLHSNEIRNIEGLDGLSDLRVLNLAGNKIESANNLSSLTSLTELNLRRNFIESVDGLQRLPTLQRIFLSHNCIKALTDIECLFEVSFLIELSLDGNPLSDSDPAKYRKSIISGMNGLRHLDLKRITDEEREEAAQFVDSDSFRTRQNPPTASSNVQDSQQQSKDLDELNAFSGQTNMFIPPNELLRMMMFPMTDVNRKPPTLTSVHDFSSKDSSIQIQVISLTESRLIIAGEDWNWQDIFQYFDPDIESDSKYSMFNQLQTILRSIVEVSINSVNEESIQSKLSEYIKDIVHSPLDNETAMSSLFENVKIVRLVGNNFTSYSQLDFIQKVFNNFPIEHLFVVQNPICSSHDQLRKYCISHFEELKSFNGLQISKAERITLEVGTFGTDPPSYDMKTLMTNDTISRHEVAPILNTTLSSRSYSEPITNLEASDQQGQSGLTSFERKNSKAIDVETEIQSPRLYSRSRSQSVETNQNKNYDREEFNPLRINEKTSAEVANSAHYAMSKPHIDGNDSSLSKLNELRMVPRVMSDEFSKAFDGAVRQIILDMLIAVKKNG